MEGAGELRGEYGFDSFTRARSGAGIALKLQICLWLRRAWRPTQARPTRRAHPPARATAASAPPVPQPAPLAAPPPSAAGRPRPPARPSPRPRASLAAPPPWSRHPRATALRPLPTALGVWRERPVLSRAAGAPPRPAAPTPPSAASGGLRPPARCCTRPGMLCLQAGARVAQGRARLGHAAVGRAVHCRAAGRGGRAGP